jgi:hypothetical protein
MALSSLLIRCFCVVNDRVEPIGVLPNVEDYVSLNVEALPAAAGSAHAISHITGISLIGYSSASYAAMVTV